MENRRGFRRGTHMGGQARRSLCRHRLGSGARQICLKIKLISRLGAEPSLSLSLSLSPSLFPSPSFSALIPLPSRSFFSLSLSISPPLSSSTLGISRTRANRRHGTEMEAKKEVGRRSPVPPTRTRRREEKVAQQQRALDFWLRPPQGRTRCRCVPDGRSRSNLDESQRNADNFGLRLRLGAGSLTFPRRVVGCIDEISFARRLILLETSTSRFYPRADVSLLIVFCERVNGIPLSTREEITRPLALREHQWRN